MSNHSMLGRGWRGRPRGGLAVLTPEQRSLARPPRHVEVPPELADREQEFEFPRVELPAGHPHVTASELRAALDGPEPVTGPVVPSEPQPASAPGLGPADAPQVPLYIGTALPPQLTAWELDLYAGTTQPLTAVPVTAGPPDPFAQLRAELDEIAATVQADLDQLGEWIAGYAEAGLDRITRRSEEMRQHLVGDDLFYAGHAMADTYADGGTQEIAGLAANLAAMIVANAKAQPVIDSELAGMAA